MADILIRMEMPQNRLFCPCSFWDEKTLALWCHALSTYDDNLVAENVTAIEAHSGKPSKAKRPDWCPLDELPEHGDLIDADSLADDLLYDVELAERALDDTSLVGKEREYAQSEKDIKQNCAYYVSHAPVVVPSNKEGTE